VKFLGALYLIWVLFTAALGAFLGSEAFCHMFFVAGPTRYPLLASGLHVVLIGVLFLQAVVLHLRMPSNKILAVGFLLITAVLLAGLHLLK
jgi:hypothetical protein